MDSLCFCIFFHVQENVTSTHPYALHSEINCSMKVVRKGGEQIFE